MRYISPIESDSPSTTYLVPKEATANSSKFPLYQILSPFPNTSRTEPDTLINPSYGNHAIIAEGAVFDMPHKNAWIFATNKQNLSSFGQDPSRPQVMIELEDGTWEKRDQSLEPEYDDESDGEILYLDNNIMERNLDTGFIGECGRSGCLKLLGCVDCQGKRPKIPTPRSTFREAILNARNKSPTMDLPPDPPITSNLPLESRENTNECFPKHLQRLGSPSVVIPYKPPRGSTSFPVPIFAPRTGPKIKYVRKRAAETAFYKTPIIKKEKAVYKKRRLR